jgi:hypothetical protein
MVKPPLSPELKSLVSDVAQMISLGKHDNTELSRDGRN